MKPFILILILLPIFVITQGFAQHDTTIFFSKSGIPVSSQSAADHYQTLVQSEDFHYTMTTHNLIKKKWVKTLTAEIYPKDESAFMVVETGSSEKKDTSFWQVQAVDSGFMISEFRDGIIRAKGFSHLIAPFVKEGLWIYYMPETSGPDRDETYRNNKIVDIRYWDEETDKFITDVYTVAEVNPEFKGGDKALYEFLAAQIMYPEEAKSNGQQGRVFVNFIIMEDGSVKRVRLLSAPSPILGQEAVRVVALTDGRWKPGMHKGVPARVSYNLPIMFTLQ